MPRVMIEQYSNFFDQPTRLQFEPVLDRRSGCYVGVCEMSAEQAEAFRGRSSFTLLSEDEWRAMTEIARQPAPTEPETGDPLADQAKDKPAPKPPAAPRSR
jgi:predicted component of type VI protein secretion system